MLVLFIVTKQHWPAPKCLNKSCTGKKRIHPGLTANAGPKYCVSARSRQDKATQEAGSDVLGGCSGNAPLGNRHLWAFHFLLRDTSSGEQVCPDLINDCAAGGNSGQTWISAPWHALMGMATELELGMLPADPNSTCTSDLSLPVSHSGPAIQNHGVSLFLSAGKDEVHPD